MTNSNATTTSKSNPAARPPRCELTDSIHGIPDDSIIEYKYKLRHDEDEYVDDWPDVEDLSHYEQGGFHPVLLGDFLGDGGRFRVVHKLGYGRFATVWLCHDSVSKKWRAVKIMAARDSTADCPDMRALKIFDGMDPDVLTAKGVQLPLEHFWIKGPNGRHLCFVLPLLGQPLRAANMYGHVPELMKDICFRLVMALKFIHSQGLCHGNFGLRNILFRLVDGVDEWEEEAMLELLGEPEEITVQSIDGPEVGIEPCVPRYLVAPSTIECDAGVCSSQIAVIDFGASYPVTQPPENGTYTPTSYESPESLFLQYGALGFHSDIWALGVVLCEVRLAIEPISENDPYTSPGLEALLNMERIMGPLPEPYRSIFKEWDGKFVNSVDEKGEPLTDDSWKDESVMATLRRPGEETLLESLIRYHGHPNMLKSLMRSARHMVITDKEATHITNQAAADPSRMPGTSGILDEDEYSSEDELDYYLPVAELEQMYDLLIKIFRWHPQDRATIDQIADHKWFGDRNKQNRAATDATSTDTTTTATTDNEH